MKIDEKSIKGIFVYDENALYESGDFIINDDIIYVCRKDIPNKREEGIDYDLDSEFYTVYLGDKMVTEDDYKNFVRNNEGEDKYISFKFLKDILDRYSFGSTVDGYTKDADEVVSLYPNVENLDTFFEPDYTSVNLILKRDSPLLKNTLLYEYSPKNAEESADSYILFKQYAYKTRTGDLPLELYLSGDNDARQEVVKIQELIDPESGLLFYRSNNPSNSNFRLATIQTKSLQEKINELIIYYGNRLNYLDSLIKNVEGNFRFSGKSFSRENKIRKLSLWTLPESPREEIPLYHISSTDTIITVLVETKDTDNGFYTTYQGSFNARNPITSSDKDFNIYLADGISISVKMTKIKTSNNGEVDMISMTLKGSNATNANIISYYYQNHYVE